MLIEFDLSGESGVLYEQQRPAMYLKLEHRS